MANKDLRLVGLALLAHEFRAEFDKLLEKYGARYHFSYKGKTSHCCIVFRDDPDHALPLIKVVKGQGAFYTTIEEEAREL